MLVNQSYAFIFSQLEQQVSLKYLAPHSTERPTQLLTPHITGGDDLHGYHSNLVSIQNKIKMVTIQIWFQFAVRANQTVIDRPIEAKFLISLCTNLFVRALE